LQEAARREFWVHEPTATVWAVEHVAGDIIGVAGPLPAADADTRLLDDLPYRASGSLWVTLNRNAFRPLTR